MKDFCIFPFRSLCREAQFTRGNKHFALILFLNYFTRCQWEDLHSWPLSLRSPGWVNYFSFLLSQMAGERMKKLVAIGKVTLHHCDVIAMPLADSVVDKVFHCNCYYFWPDLRKGTAEIHRVMKPGGLWLCLCRVLANLTTDSMEVHHFISSFDFLSLGTSTSLFKSDSIYCTFHHKSLPLLSPTLSSQEAWWCPLCGRSMRPLWHLRKWCQWKTGTQRPTWQHWESRASLTSEWKTKCTNTSPFRLFMPLPLNEIVYMLPAVWKLWDLLWFFQHHFNVEILWFVAILSIHMSRNFHILASDIVCT